MYLIVSAQAHLRHKRPKRRTRKVEDCVQSDQARYSQIMWKRGLKSRMFLSGLPFWGIMLTKSSTIQYVSETYFPTWHWAHINLYRLRKKIIILHLNCSVILQAGSRMVSWSRIRYELCPEVCRLLRKAFNYTEMGLFPASRLYTSFSIITSWRCRVVAFLFPYC